MKKRQLKTLTTLVKVAAVAASVGLAFLEIASLKTNLAKFLTEPHFITLAFWLTVLQTIHHNIKVYWNNQRTQDFSWYEKLALHTPFFIVIGGTITQPHYTWAGAIELVGPPVILIWFEHFKFQVESYFVSLIESLKTILLTTERKRRRKASKSKSTSAKANTRRDRNITTTNGNKKPVNKTYARSTKTLAKKTVKTSGNKTRKRADKIAQRKRVTAKTKSLADVAKTTNGKAPKKPPKPNKPKLNNKRGQENEKKLGLSSPNKI